MEIIVFMIALIATTLGSLAGLGGGIIIKPILDMFDMNVLLVGILSSFTILSMAIVSSVKHLHARRVKKNVLYIAIGASLGGLIGNLLLVKMATDPLRLKETQSLSLVILLVIILILIRLKKYLRTFNVTSRTVIVSVGLLLGVISAFLGIGGGPLNMIVLYVLFGLNTKDAAASSVFIIMFAQAMKIFFVDTSFELGFLYYMIPGGVVGGFIGAYYNKKISEKVVSYIFNSMIVTMILVNIYNLVQL